MQSEVYVNESDELAVIDMQEIDKNITFNNCHLVVKYWITFKPQLIEAIVNEHEAQIRFGDRTEEHD